MVPAPPIPPKVNLVATSMVANNTTIVDALQLGADGLTIAMRSDAWDATISFPQIYGFRVLDELGLTEFWSQCSLKEGCLFEVISGGWKSLEMTRAHFFSGRAEWVKEYLIVGLNECVSVLTKEDVVVHVQQRK